MLVRMFYLFFRKTDSETTTEDRFNHRRPIAKKIITDDKNKYIIFLIFIVFKFVRTFAAHTIKVVDNQSNQLFQSVKLWQSVVMQFIRAFAKRPYITYPKITFNYSLMSSKSNCFFIRSVFFTRIITSSPSW